MKTCLYDIHVALKGKLIDYEGYLLPVEYSGIIDEHLAIRNGAGIFDVSHMGEIAIKGSDSLEFLDKLLTCNIRESKNNTMIYSLMLDEEGLIIDDLMVYKFSDEDFMIITNACNNIKDYAYILEKSSEYDVSVFNRSEDIALVALQGLLAEDYLQRLTTYDLKSLRMFCFDNIDIQNREFLVSRSGYTGSDGFEIYGSKEDIKFLFPLLIDSGVIPCGLGCRDTLRFEAAMPLYGHEIGNDINPLEAGLSFAIDFSKDFIGKKALEVIRKEGPKRKIVGLQLLEKRIARNGYIVFSNDKQVGYITTGYLIPGTEMSLALALIDIEYATIGNILSVAIRKNLVEALVRNKKFMKKEYKR